MLITRARHAKSPFARSASAQVRMETSSNRRIALERKPCSEAKHSAAPHEGHQAAKANRKERNAPAQCGGDSTTGLSNNSYL